MIQMNKYVMILSYLGTNYSGWQIQDNSISVQGSIMDALHKILNKNIPLMVGAGRTDSGVHAMNFVAHFESEDIIAEEIKYKLNRFLPNDIVIHKLKKVSEDFHARYSAISRKYEYWISTQKNPFLIDRTYFFTQNLNLELMNQGANLLVGKQDFGAFSKSKLDNNICKISSACWFKSKNMVIFSIEADRFLYNMVRCIVGTLIDLGVGKINLKELQNIIKNKNRSQSGYSVPASGLYLLDIQYPKKYNIESI
tara:strand:+ start:432 stop:1190 length:759 start_codon:yes stop_codon:yes gene_type:complete